MAKGVKQNGPKENLETIFMFGKKYSYLRRLGNGGGVLEGPSSPVLATR